MAQKRPFDDEVVDVACSKHQRQVGPVGEFTPCNDWKGADFQKHSNSGEVSFGNGELNSCDQHIHGSCSEIFMEGLEKSGIDAPRSDSFSHWVNRTTSDEDEPPEEAVCLPFNPGYFSFDYPERSAIDCDDVYYCLAYPRKRIPVGPEHQAVIPTWGSLENQNTVKRNSVEKEGVNIGGICISSNAGSQTFADSEKVGNGRADCRCQDQGSIRCVRQHIADAREKLRGTVGPDAFMELGFSDMGEVVAEKWSIEEEQLFHEVVYSNPMSLGKNFWNGLSAVFPSRTKMDIVSYYFNVFMLRKRAEQNRAYPVNIDSDNDEWQGIDDGVDEGGLSEEDDHFGPEYPVRHDASKLHQTGLGVHEHEQDDGNISDEIQVRNENDIVGYIRKYNANSPSKLSEKNDEVGENDVQDGSCTSSEQGSSVQEAQMKTDGCHEWHGYLVDSSDC